MNDLDRKKSVNFQIDKHGLKLKQDVLQNNYKNNYEYVRKQTQMIALDENKNLLGDFPMIPELEKEQTTPIRIEAVATPDANSEEFDSYLLN